MSARSCTSPAYKPITPNDNPHPFGPIQGSARSAWQALKLYIEQSLEAPLGYQAGAVVCIQTFAENLRWNPHVHVLLLSGMLNLAGEFLPLSHWDLQVLSEIFRREVCRMLQSKGLLTEERLRLLYSWRHMCMFCC